MLGLEKLIASLVMPPGIFLLLTITITFYLFLKTKSKLIKLTAVLTVSALLIMSTGLGVKILLIPLENYAEQVTEEVENDYPIAVLGGGVYYKNESEVQLSVHSLQRLTKGVKIYKKTESPIIYSGGIAVGQKKLSEADAAEDYLFLMGVDREDYYPENRAQSTYENGKYVKEWMENSNIDKIYLVTSAYHMFRSSAVFSAQGVDFLPVHSGFIYDHKFSWLDYLPSRGALSVNMSALHEWIGIIWYYLNGRI